METLKGNIGLKGKYRFKRYAPSDKSLEELPLEQRQVVWEGPWIKNLVMSTTTTGTGMITSRLIGETTSSLAITQGKIGTGTNAPTSSDSDLQTTILSGIVKARQTATATTATIEFFIPADDLPNGTYTEFGIFVGSSIFARSLISPTYDKSTNEDIGIEYIVSVDNT